MQTEAGQKLFVSPQRYRVMNDGERARHAPHPFVTGDDEFGAEDLRAWLTIGIKLIDARAQLHGDASVAWAWDDAEERTR
ncbi:hypothetical protein [Sandaracinus amylolyticus]|uniref:hypothetical protein n=1 Tax=Sandaracinus amylolyticus TaxID=927083 RepID=UPI001F1E7FFB|nr:hypothetical protein [Sandaracinus amylolyticus]UJR78915.1 Hypothetical protein I5071_9480 [Sandaracinus amylolyticus]